MLIKPSKEQALGPFYTPAEEAMMAEIERLRDALAEIADMGVIAASDYAANVLKRKPSMEPTSIANSHNNGEPSGD